MLAAQGMMAVAGLFAGEEEAGHGMAQILLAPRRFPELAECKGGLAFSDMAVGQNEWYRGDWDVHWRYGMLTHGHMLEANLPFCTPQFAG